MVCAGRLRTPKDIGHTQSQLFYVTFCLKTGHAVAKFLGRSLRGAWMFVLCVLNQDKSQKYRTIKTKKQVRMKYREQENTKKN
jgi:hypothetical protein